MGKNALQSSGVTYTLVELDECGEARNGDVQQILNELTGRMTVTNAIVKGKSIGGGTELQKLASSGKLKMLLTEQGCAFK